MQGLQERDVQLIVRTGRIVVGAMIASLVTFGTVASVIEVPRLDSGTATALFVVLFAFGGTSISIAVLLPRVLSRRIARAAPSGASKKALASFSLQRLILSVAPLEAFGLFGAVVYLLTGHGLGLAALGLALVWLVGSFPSEHSLERHIDWAIEDAELDRLDAERDPTEERETPAGEAERTRSVEV